MLHTSNHDYKLILDMNWQNVYESELRGPATPLVGILYMLLLIYPKPSTCGVRGFSYH